MTGLRLVFMGTPDFAMPALKALLASPHSVIAAYAQPPRPAGRGLALAKSPVQRLAEANDIPVFTPVHFKDAETQAEFSGHRADAAVVAAYGLILPEAILAAPRFGCINIHASLLPRWRGAAPIARAILAGDSETGITLMRMEKGLDTGPILAQERVAITPADNAGTLHDRLAELGALMIVPALDALAKGKLIARLQDEARATLAPKISKADAEIHWREPADAVARKVRAFSPAPGAWTVWKGTRLRVLAGTVIEGKGAPGEALDNQLGVACGKGAYRITRLQREGKAPLEAGAFLRGAPVAKGERLT
jgi:methionyl-tRNA formyltransferase